MTFFTSNRTRSIGRAAEAVAEALADVEAVSGRVASVTV
jgi:hypothetical protein